MARSIKISSVLLILFILLILVICFFFWRDMMRVFEGAETMSSLEMPKPMVTLSSVIKEKDPNKTVKMVASFDNTNGTGKTIYYDTYSGSLYIIPTDQVPRSDEKSGTVQYRNPKTNLDVERDGQDGNVVTYFDRTGNIVSDFTYGGGYFKGFDESPTITAPEYTVEGNKVKSFWISGITSLDILDKDTKKSLIKL